MFAMTKKRAVLVFVSYMLASVMTLAQRGHFIPSERFSSSLISGLCQDRQGSIWIATDYGLNRFDGYHFQTFIHDEGDSTSIQANVIVSLFCDPKGRLWVGTNRGLDRFETSSESFVHYTFPDGRQPRVTQMTQHSSGALLVGTAGYGAYILGDDDRLHRFSDEQLEPYFSRVYEDAAGRLWRSGFDDKIYMRSGDQTETFFSEHGNPQGIIEFGGELLVLCQHGFMAYADGRMHVADIDMSIVEGRDVIFTLMKLDNEGNLIVGTRGQGLYRIPSQRPWRLEQVSIDAFGIDMSTAKISAATFDRHGNLWLGCHRKGLLMLPQRPVQFQSWNFEDQGIRLGSTISSVCEGDEGITWCTVQGVGVYGFSPQGRVVAHPASPPSVEFVFRDRQQRYWLGTDDGLFAYDPTTGRSQLKVNFECDKFNDMTSDDEGNIFISTFSRGFCVYNPATGQLRNYNMSNDDDEVKGRLCNNWVMGMSADSRGLIWLATSSGVACFDPRTESFRSQGWQNLLESIVCFDVCELHAPPAATTTATGIPDLAGAIAIGTEQGLFLYDRQTKQAERFPGSEQLTNKVVTYIVQSNDGDIWCSTSQGIWHYSLNTGTFTGYVNGNGITQKEYIYGVGMHTDDDVIYFGHNDGMTVFSPDRIKGVTFSPDTLQLVSFCVGNEYVNSSTVLNGVHVVDKAVSDASYFTLSYLDHTITMAFSQFNFDNPSNVTYEYRVNGGQWVTNPEGKNDFTLGHLQPGTYRIEARASQGNEYTPVKVVVVTVRAPWYRTTLAYFFYMLLLLGLIGFIAWMYRRRIRERLDEDKMKFLINATHDIRSPLTLIMSPLEKIKRHVKDTSDAEMQQSIDTIDHNAKRILNLVNQILDVRKIDKQQMHLHCQQTDLVVFTKGIGKMFEYNAQERNITFKVSHDGLDEFRVWVDRNQFDKVITNLLSNAFKFCGDGGNVQLLVSRHDDEAQIQVVDDGQGLDSNNLKHIFDRFYQGKNSQQMHVEGTGIGLNLCKMIVDMHHGTIEAANRTDTHGAVFTVRLPLGNAHLRPEEIDLSKLEEPATIQTPVKTPTTKHRVLIVDDDVELGNYISAELGRYYRFGLCANGKEGLKELLTNDYDVIVSDVMMPEMDGFTMLRMIKTNLNLSHLPVVMLTSKADVANRLEGLERGADAFLAKPFVMEELHMVIENLIQSRLRLKGKFSGAQKQTDRVEQLEVKGNDEQLMERIMKAINKNLSDSDFNVEMLTQEVGISRAQLHRKMKEMTGISTSEFIRNIRLEQAARLLKEQKINVTQVAYTVGFSNLAHFSTIFRKHFGVAPSEYAGQEGD